MNSSLTFQWTKRVSFPRPLHPRAPRVSAICHTQGSRWTAAPGALTGTGWSLLAVCVCLCVCACVYVCVWSFFWQLDVRAHVLVCLEEEGRVLKAYVCVRALCSLPLQQLQLSAEALARSLLSSLMGSGNSLYSSTSVSCLRAFRAIV